MSEVYKWSDVLKPFTYKTNTKKIREDLWWAILNIGIYKEKIKNLGRLHRLSWSIHIWYKILKFNWMNRFYCVIILMICENLI